MKMTDADFNLLKATVQPLDTHARRAQYLAGDFPHASKYRDVGKRYRWDLLHLSGFKVASLYTYLNDRNIDTALLRIVQPGLLGAP